MLFSHKDRKQEKNTLSFITQSFFYQNLIKRFCGFDFKVDLIHKAPIYYVKSNQSQNNI